MNTIDNLWNEDGTPRLGGVQASRLKLREILKTEYEWEQKEIDDFVPIKPHKKGGNDLATEREQAINGALEAWKDDMRKAGWTEEKIEEFLLTH